MNLAEGRNAFKNLGRVFFAQFSGNAKQGFVRDFELDHFLSQLDGKKSELGNFYLIFQQFFNKIMAILFENLS